MAMFKSVVKDYNGTRPWTLHYTEWCKKSGGTIHALEDLKSIDFGNTKNARILSARPGTKIKILTVWRGGELFLVRMTDEEISKHDQLASLEQRLSDLRAKIYAYIPKEWRDLERVLERQIRQIKKEKK